MFEVLEFVIVTWVSNCSVPRLHKTIDNYANSLCQPNMMIIQLNQVKLLSRISQQHRPNAKLERTSPLNQY